jgi:transcriptional regulator GlxA family with amidase domain
MGKKTPDRARTRALRVHVLALRDCTPLVPVGMVELLRKSLALAATLPSAEPLRPVEVTLVAGGPGRVVLGAGGLPVHCAATLRQVRRSDLVVVPALDPDLLQHLALNRQVVPWLRRIYRAGADVVSVCTGSFLLAEAGLLDGRAATTHWAFQDLLRARHPRVRLEPQAIIVDQGRICTAGGATSFLNLALFLVERLLGAEVARAAAKMFLVDLNKSPQGTYAIFSTQKTHADPEILRAQTLIEGELGGKLSVEELSQRVAMSRRTFVRRFKRATGNVPREYIQRVRVEAAKRALESGRASVASVADQTGYEDVVAFRKVFVRITGLTPVEYRLRYGPPAPPATIKERV